MHKPNNLVESEVRDELGWDPILDDTRIVVQAQDGRVTLTGSVYTYDESVLASEDAWSVAGVGDVSNDLLVGPVGAALADADVAAACVVALDADRVVPKGAVTPVVVDGWVTLSGEVRDHFQRQAAEHAVRRVRGVLGLTDTIAITSDPVPGDVVDRINKALRRNALVNDSLIEVSNVGSTIYLDGKTGSWAARTEAEDAAWAAPGVTDVVDRLVIVD